MKRNQLCHWTNFTQQRIIVMDDLYMLQKNHWVHTFNNLLKSQSAVMVAVQGTGGYKIWRMLQN